LIIACTNRGDTSKPHEEAIRFLEGQTGAVIKVPRGKSRITIRLDDDVLDWFRKQVDDAGGGSYQNLINRALRAYIERSQEPLEDIPRRVVREELRRAC
jgi:uncharacterized protein (DUF4415 family)